MTDPDVPAGPLAVAIDVSPVMDLPLTGVGYHVLGLIEALLENANGFDIRLFAARSRHTPESSFPFIRGFSQKRVVSHFRRLKTILWSRVNWPPIEWFTGRVDVAHGLFHDLPASRRARRLATIHDLSFRLLPETHTRQTIARETRLVQHCIRKADLMLAVSEQCRHDVHEAYKVPMDRIFVTPGGIRLDEFEPAPERLKTLRHKFGVDAPYFIYVGTIEPRKNLTRLIAAYARVRAKRNDAPLLVLVGRRGWDSEAVFKAITNNRLQGAVLYLGYLARTDSLALLKGAEACVYPSLYEGFGLPVLEAMAARVAVVTSKAGALLEVSGGHALHVDATDVDGLTHALETVLDKQEAVQAMVAKARQRAETLTWSQSAARLAQAYRLVAGA